jgi:hypothetical protein
VAWMIDLELTSPAEAQSLLDAAAYEGLTK